MTKNERVGEAREAIYKGIVATAEWHGRVAAKLEELSSEDGARLVKKYREKMKLGRRMQVWYAEKAFPEAPGV